MFGVGFCLCVCLLLIHIVSMEVDGEKYITGLGGADFGDCYGWNDSRHKKDVLLVCLSLWVWLKQDFFAA